LFSIKAIDHLVIRARNLDRMIEFYREVLGCTVEKRVDAIGLVHLRAGRSLIDLISVEGKLGLMGGAPPGIEGHNMDHFCLWIEPFNIDEIRNHLQEHGIDAGELHTNFGAEGDGPSIYIKDPEGNVIELKGYSH
jgi:glyoxylase I family protein